MMDTRYTPQSAYKFGDYYKRARKWLAAELCYALPNVKDHPINQEYSNHIIEHILNELIQFRKANNYQLPPKGTDIPTQALQLIKSFYSIWLNEHIKPDLIKRAEDHANKRAAALVKIFAEVTSKYDNIGKLDIGNIIKDLLQKQTVKINTWQGPSFNKLQYKKHCNKLTVVMEFKDYRKRCRNSQEDWFKKYDAEFFAKCLTEIVQTFESRVFEKDIPIVKIKFAQRFLTRKIQFPLAAARTLLPAGTLFNSNELQDALNKFHDNLNAKHIKQTSDSTKVKDLHLKLLNICENTYNSLINNTGNINISNITVTDNMAMEQDDNFSHNNIDMLHESFRFDNESVFSDGNIQSISNGNYRQPQQPLQLYRPPMHSNQHQMNRPIYYQSVPMQYQPQMQIQYTPSISDVSTVSTGTSSICTVCQEHQCKCHNNSVTNNSPIMQYNPPQITQYNQYNAQLITQYNSNPAYVYMNNNNRQFQNSYGYLRPQSRIHNNLIIHNNRQQRLFEHQQRLFEQRN